MPNLLSQIGSEAVRNDTVRDFRPAWLVASEDRDPVLSVVTLIVGINLALTFLFCLGTWSR